MPGGLDLADVVREQAERVAVGIVLLDCRQDFLHLGLDLPKTGGPHYARVERLRVSRPAVLVHELRDVAEQSQRVIRELHASEQLAALHPVVGRGRDLLRHLLHLVVEQRGEIGPAVVQLVVLVLHGAERVELVIERTRAVDRVAEHRRRRNEPLAGLESLESIAQLVDLLGLRVVHDGGDLVVGNLLGRAARRQSDEKCSQGNGGQCAHSASSKYVLVLLDGIIHIKLNLSRASYSPTTSATPCFRMIG